MEIYSSPVALKRNWLKAVGLFMSRIRKGFIYPGMEGAPAWVNKSRVSNNVMLEVSC